MRKMRKFLGMGLVVAAAMAPAVGASATMTAWNIEKFHTMPFTLSRMDYSERTMTVAFRGEVTHLNAVLVDWPTYDLDYADRHFEAMREDPVEWGITVFNGDVAGLPRYQEVVLPLDEGFDMYEDDKTGYLYYAISFADGGHYEGKIMYNQGCIGPLRYGWFDEEAETLIEYSDREYECRIQYAEGQAALNPHDGEYMSNYTRRYWTGGNVVETTYEYVLEPKSEPMKNLPADIKTLEQVAAEEVAREEARLAEAARLEEEARREEAHRKEVEYWKTEAEKAPEVVIKTEVVQAEPEVIVKTEYVEVEPEVVVKTEVVEGEPKIVTETRTEYVPVVVKSDEVALATSVETVMNGGNDAQEEISDGDESVLDAVPGLSNHDGRPWWLLMPVTAIATFLICWWLLPEVRYKKQK